MAKFLFYAVQAGFVPGVYPSWPEAQRQIQGYRFSKHKGFNDLAAAEAFAGAPLVRDRFADPFVVVHVGQRPVIVALTDRVREALVADGVDLGR